MGVDKLANTEIDPDTGAQARTAARYVHSLCQLAQSSGTTTEKLLAGTGLDGSLLRTQEEYVSHSVLDRFLANVERQTGERRPGLLLGHNLNVSAHGAVGYAGLTAINAGKAMEVAIRYFGLITSLVSLQLDREGARARLTITPAAGITARTEQFALHTLLASFDVMGNFLVGGLKFSVSLAFPEQPDLKQRLSGAIQTISFDQPAHCFLIPSAQMQVPFVLADRSAHEHAIAECDRELAELRRHKYLADRVLAILAQADGQLPEQQTVSDILGMSSRTLHRRLRSEGVSYRALTSRVLIDRAKHCLLRRRMTVTETAFSLGYRDSANFTRAFRQATGLSPTEFRARASADGEQELRLQPLNHNRF